ncbi:MAG TPA: efflux transporter outer membrane subunit [Rhizomicrobium sp.]|jgi:NodT family efflux transporter outer membrane factor (OMF) lipoprotein
MKRALPLVLLIAGCTVGPDYSRPNVPVPTQYNAPAQTEAPLSQPVTEAADLSRWWIQFHDAELESLITRALAQNPDLLTAQSRVREAREQEIIAGAAGLPQIDATGSAVRLHSESSLQQKLGSGGAAMNGVTPPGGTDLKLYSAGFDATWEIDIFGGVRRSVEAAEAGTEAARWQMRDAEVTLTAEIAADYVTLRADQARLAILADQEKSQRATLDLTVAKARTGFVTELDVNQQRQLVASTTAQRPPLISDVLAMHHAIAVLLGQQPGTLDTELGPAQPVPPIPPRLPVGLPSELLRARPDIRMAERKLAQATAQIGVAVADLYPKFDLLAAANFSSNHISNLLSGDNLGQVGLGSIMWPVFHGGQIHANIRAKEEEEKQAYFAYQKAVLGGLQNAEDALVRYQTEQRRFLALQDAVKTAHQSTDLALQQYRTGLVAYASVLQAQSTQLTAEDNLAQSRSALTANLISLYKALGGGWKDVSVALPATENPLFTQ